MEEALTEHLKTLVPRRKGPRNGKYAASLWTVLFPDSEPTQPQGQMASQRAYLRALYKNRKSIASLFNDIFAGVDIPADWQRGRVALILRRGGKAGNLQDYRPLTVTSTMYRLFTQVLKGWISGWAECKGQLTELQNGFRKEWRLDEDRQETRTLIVMLLHGCPKSLRQCPT
ncbi:hypothetical protein MRX96_037140 [Rhipicephalus microplus]